MQPCILLLLLLPLGAAAVVATARQPGGPQEEESWDDAVARVTGFPELPQQYWAERVVNVQFPDGTTDSDVHEWVVFDGTSGTRLEMSLTGEWVTSGLTMTYTTASRTDMVTFDPDERACNPERCHPE
jgi:hypothetical protein